METICLMRDIYRAIQTFEADFQKVHRVCMNEAMLLCSLSGGKSSAAEIAAINAMRPSHRKEMPCGDVVRLRGGARDPAAGVPGPVRRPGIRRV